MRSKLGKRFQVRRELVFGRTSTRPCAQSMPYQTGRLMISPIKVVWQTSPLTVMIFDSNMGVDSLKSAMTTKPVTKVSGSFLGQVSRSMYTFLVASSIL